MAITESLLTARKSAPFALPFSDLKALPAQVQPTHDLPRFSDVEVDETFFMLSAIIRLGVTEALTKRVLEEPKLLNRYIAPELYELGYRESPEDKRVLIHPRTRQDGWIMALGEGKSLWGASYIVAGPITGAASTDLFYAVEQAKAHISDKFFSLFKHPGMRITDSLAMRGTEPSRSIFKEIKTLSDAQEFITRNAEDLPSIKADLPVYWNRPTYLTAL